MLFQNQKKTGNHWWLREPPKVVKFGTWERNPTSSMLDFPLVCLHINPGFLWFAFKTSPVSSGLPLKQPRKDAVKRRHTHAHNPSAVPELPAGSSRELAHNILRHAGLQNFHKSHFLRGEACWWLQKVRGEACRWLTISGFGVRSDWATMPRQNKNAKQSQDVTNNEKLNRKPWKQVDPMAPLWGSGSLEVASLKLLQNIMTINKRNSFSFLVRDPLLLFQVP